jgi:4-hydroxy-2-oxoheptanedioate aldolase
VLDCGVYGIVFPMINTVEDAEHALQASRYIQARGAEDAAPVGRRGHAPANAIRCWGITQSEYYDKADVRPLDPRGEILPILQCETQQGGVTCGASSPRYPSRG